jgi:predicted dehydrogenase
MLGDEKIAFLQGRWVGPMPSSFWWPQLELSGGQMTEQCTHIVDLARHFGGEVAHVSAAGAKTLTYDAALKHDIWDSQVACLSFASGIVASIHTSHATPGVPGCGLSIYTPESCYEIGEAPWSSRLTVYRRGQVLRFNGQDCGWREPRNEEDDAFIRALRTKDPSGIRCDYSEGCRTLAVNLAITKACQTGEAVKVSDMG